MTIVTGYPLAGGVYAETAALTHVLTQAGVRHPATGEPLSEALVFGIGGGLGAGYIMFEWQEHQTKVLVMGFGHLWNYTGRFFQGAADRLGARVTMPEASGKKAAALLDDALAADRAAVAWVDRAHLPYLHVPMRMSGYLGHVVGVCGRDGDDYLIDDRAPQPYRVERQHFNAGRARISSYKSRLLLVESVAPFDLTAAVRAGIAAQLDYLNSDSDSFSLPTFRKWGRMMTDAKNKKGWHVLFADRRGLYTTLRSLYENILFWTDGGGLRPLYARFLREAAALLGDDGLLAAADACETLGAQWRDLADAALPDAVFAETKRLLSERDALIKQGGEGWREAETHTHTLQTLSTQYNTDFPLDAAAVNALFTDLGERLTALYTHETAALALLTR